MVDPKEKMNVKEQIIENIKYDDRNHDDRNHDDRNHDGRNHDGRNHDGRNHDDRNHDDRKPNQWYQNTENYNTKTESFKPDNFESHRRSEQHRILVEFGKSGPPKYPPSDLKNYRSTTPTTEHVSSRGRTPTHSMEKR